MRSPATASPNAPSMLLRFAAARRPLCALLMLASPDAPAPLTDAVQQQRSPAAGHMGGRSMGHAKKIRQHVNPLKDVHSRPLILPERWPETAFRQPSQPLHVDVGCARGIFCLDLAAAAPELNVVGLEIRGALADAAQEDVRSLDLGNAAFFATNANVNLRGVLSGAAELGALRSVSIQFPDPWFKARHHKRRVVQPALVTDIAEHLPPGGWLWMQSDVLEVALDMREQVRLAEPVRLRDSRDDLDDWDVARPEGLCGVQTERERASAELERPVYRCLFVATGEQ